MINQDKPTTSLSNSAKTSVGETWATDLKTWGTENRTWLAISKLINNTSLGMIQVWNFWNITWDTEVRTWDAMGKDSIINQSKPL